jgi:hypothetical protein
MSEKRILIVEEEILKKIDENRGDMSRSEFIRAVINSQLNEEPEMAPLQQQFLSREEFMEFSQGIKDLLRRFLDFFLAYGLELGKEPKDTTFAELVQKLQTLSAGSIKSKASK